MSYKEPGNNCNCSFFLVLFFNLISDYVIYNFMYTLNDKKQGNYTYEFYHIFILFSYMVGDFVKII